MSKLNVVAASPLPGRFGRIRVTTVGRGTRGPGVRSGWLVRPIVV